MSGAARMTAAQYRARAARRTPEDAVQRAIVELLESLPPPPDGPWWTAVNPVPAKSKAAAGRSKALGLRPGTPDIVMSWRGRFIGIEVKRPIGGVVSSNQKDVHRDIALTGGLVTVVRSVDEVRDFLETVGILLPQGGRG